MANFVLFYLVLFLPLSILLTRYFIFVAWFFLVLSFFLLCNHSEKLYCAVTFTTWQDLVDRPWENDELQEFFSSSILNGTWIKLCSDIKYQGHEKSNDELLNNKYYIAIRKTAIVDDLSTTPVSDGHSIYCCFVLLPHFRLVSRRLFQLIVSLSPYSYPNFCIEMYLARFQRLCWLR